MVDDKAKIKELWKPSLKAWFPEGENDPEITLLKVDAHHAQYWDTPSAVAHVISLAKGLVTGQREANPGSTGKVELGNH